MRLSRLLLKDRDARGENKITAAKRLGLSKGFYSQLDNDNLYPSLECMTKLAAGLGIETHDIALCTSGSIEIVGERLYLDRLIVGFIVKTKTGYTATVGEKRLFPATGTGATNIEAVRSALEKSAVAGRMFLASLSVFTVIHR